jgi:hypothetical protein
MKTPSIFFVTVLLLLLCFEDARACSCVANGPPCEAYGQASAVFVGRVVGAAQQNEAVMDGVKTVYDVGTIRFSVQESFRGVDSKEVEIHSGTGGGDCGYWFKRDEVYLIYAHQSSEDKKLYTSICTRTRPISEASEDLEFLHGVSAANPGGTLYGVITQFSGDREHGPFAIIGPMSGLKVIVEGEGRRFEALTNNRGEYRLTGLPPGSYDARPILPDNLGAIAHGDTVDRFGSYSGHEKISLADRSCAEMSFTVQFSGLISGRVTNAEGQPVKDIEIDIVRVDDFEKGWSAWTDEDGRYEFHMVQPGSYFLGLNLEWVPSERNPYPRMFYPGVRKQSQAAMIGMGDGTKLKGYDFILLPKLVERTISGTVLWPDGRPAAGADVNFELSDYPGKSLSGQVEADQKGGFTLQLFEGLGYRIYADAEEAKDKYSHSDPVELTPTEKTKPFKLILTKPGSGYENDRVFKRSKRK